MESFYFSNRVCGVYAVNENNFLFSGDGYVSVGEFVEGHRAKGMSDTANLYIFYKLDANGDLKLTLSEINTLIDLI